MDIYKGSITDIPGLRVGHEQDFDGRTGVTALLTENGAVCGCDVRGGAPGSRETALMEQARTVKRANAVVFAGGSAFGLAAADGVMRYCEEHGMGFRTQEATIPIVPAFILYDLGTGSSSARPDAEMGYRACQIAGREVAQGRVGAGTGATVGKVLGMEYCEAGGVGTACIELGGGVLVGALICVNAVGDVWEQDSIIAGAKKDGQYIGITDYLLKTGSETQGMEGMNTTIGAIATNARLDRDDVTWLARAAHDGLARAISPVHTTMDGDAVVALSCGDKSTDLNVLVVAAAEAARQAVVNAVTAGRQK